MKRIFFIISMVLAAGCLASAQVTVDFDTDFADGWEPWIGQTVSFSNDFILCDPGGKVVASHRLRAAEEYGEEGTTAYTEALTANAHARCVLTGISFPYDSRPGTIVRNLTATVTAPNSLRVTGTPYILYNQLPDERPYMGNANVIICGANIENFFVTLGGYAGANSEEQLAVQKEKIAKGLYHMEADIYAICEMEQGNRAVTVIVDLLNTLAGQQVYDWVDAGFDYSDAVMVCFIYRADKVTPFGSYLTPYSYTNSPYHYREAIQCFEHLATGERFNISLNHFKAKSSYSDTDGTRQTNMNYLLNKLPAAANNDPDILVMGDLNAYTMEESNLMLSRDKGYVDLLMRDDPEGYSYVYNHEVGFLDHAYASPSMAPHVTRAVSYHLNADTYYRYEYKYGDTSMYRYADHDPVLVGLRLGEDDMATDEINAGSSNDGNATRKVIRHGQLVIVRSGVEYTVTGQRL